MGLAVDKTASLYYNHSIWITNEALTVEVCSTILKFFMAILRNPWEGLVIYQMKES